MPTKTLENDVKSCVENGGFRFWQYKAEQRPQRLRQLGFAGGHTRAPLEGYAF
jgi:hypothetical protein